jgi:ATP-dependent Clp protease, protease subunit
MVPPAAKKRAAQSPPPTPDAYVIFPRAIIPEMAANLLGAVTSLMNTGAKNICVSFSSVGGGVPAAFALHNNLRSLPVRLRMHAIGDVESAANVVFVAGAERTASPRSRFLFHAPTLTVEAGTELDATLLVQRAKDLAEGEARTREVLKARTNMTAATIDKLKQGQNSVDTGDAERFGLIDRVVELKIPDGARVLTV